MITDDQIKEKMRRFGYDWHSAYLACKLEEAARAFASVLFGPRK